MHLTLTSASGDFATLDFAATTTLADVLQMCPALLAGIASVAVTDLRAVHNGRPLGDATMTLQVGVFTWHSNKYQLTGARRRRQRHAAYHRRAPVATTATIDAGERH